MEGGNGYGDNLTFFADFWRFCVFFGDFVKKKGENNAKNAKNREKTPQKSEAKILGDGSLKNKYPKCVDGISTAGLASMTHKTFTVTVRVPSTTRSRSY